MKAMKPMDPIEPMASAPAHERWWPDGLGEPSSTGGANDTRYAYFAERHRLALQHSGRTRVFDTDGRRISGFAQSQKGDGDSLRFESDDGPVGLDALKEI